MVQTMVHQIHLKYFLIPNILPKKTKGWTTFIVNLPMSIYNGNNHHVICSCPSILSPE